MDDPAQENKTPPAEQPVKETSRPATEADRGYFEKVGEYFTDPEWFRNRRVQIETVTDIYPAAGAV